MRLEIFLQQVVFTGFAFGANKLNPVHEVVGRDLPECPKLYFTYVLQFQHKVLQLYFNNRTFLSNLISIFWSLKMKANAYVTFRFNTNTKTHHKTSIEYGIQKNITETEMQRASAVFSQNGTEIQNPPPEIFSRKLDVSWNFDHNAIFASNISFLELHFISNRNRCYKAKVSINYLQHCYNYCGINAAFNLYSGGFSIKINLFFHSKTHFNFSVKGHYFIMDAGGSTHHKILQNIKPATSLSQEIIHFPSKGSCKIITWILANKTKTLIVAFSHILSLKPKVFDGPGFKSKVLKPTQDKIKSSSFQCVIQMVSPLGTAIHPRNKVVFAKESYPELAVAADQETSRLLASSSCWKSPCLFVLMSNTSQQVNITIKKFALSSMEILPCRFGGVFLFDTINPEHKFPFCFGYDPRTHPRSYYSQHNSFSFVLYWYHFYTSVLVDLYFSTTNCQAVEVDFCSLRMCYEINFVPNNCPNYFEQITKGTDIHLYFPKYAVDYNLIVAEIRPHTCTVIQVRYTSDTFGWNPSMRYESCCFFLLPKALQCS